MIVLLLSFRHFYRGHILGVNPLPVGLLLDLYQLKLLDFCEIGSVTPLRFLILFGESSPTSHCGFMLILFRVML